MGGYINSEECEHAGLDPKAVQRIASGLSRYAKQADKLGIWIFGGSGSGSLRFRDDRDKNALIVGYLEGVFGGGDGGGGEDEDGLERGEA